MMKSVCFRLASVIAQRAVPDREDVAAAQAHQIMPVRQVVLVVVLLVSPMLICSARCVAVEYPGTVKVYRYVPLAQSGGICLWLRGCLLSCMSLKISLPVAGDFKPLLLSPLSVYMYISYSQCYSQICKRVSNIYGRCHM